MPKELPIVVSVSDLDDWNISVYRVGESLVAFGSDLASSCVADQNEQFKENSNPVYEFSGLEAVQDLQNFLTPFVVAPDCQLVHFGEGKEEWVREGAAINKSEKSLLKERLEVFELGMQALEGPELSL